MEIGNNVVVCTDAGNVDDGVDEEDGVDGKVDDDTETGNGGRLDPNVVVFDMVGAVTSLTSPVLSLIGLLSFLTLLPLTLIIPLPVLLPELPVLVSPLLTLLLLLLLLSVLVMFYIFKTATFAGTVAIT